MAMADDVSRRSFLKATGPAGLMAGGLPGAALGFEAATQATQEVKVAAGPPAKPNWNY